MTLTRMLQPDGSLSTERGKGICSDHGDCDRETAIVSLGDRPRLSLYEP